MRFAARRRDPHGPDALAKTISEYHRSVAQFEALENSEFDEIPSWEILRFDSCRRTVEPEEPATAFGTIVRARIVEALSTPYLADPRLSKLPDRG